MITLRRWNRYGSFSGPFSVPGEDLRAELAAIFPGEEVLIRGDGFEPISHASHCAAAGYPPPDSEEAKAYPAHFNRSFFEVLEPHAKTYHQVQEAK